MGVEAVAQAGAVRFAQHAAFEMSVSEGTQENGAQRLVIAARARIGVALTNLDQAELVKVREDLEAAENALRAAELQLGKSKFNPARRTSGPPSFPSPEGESPGFAPDTQDWLLRTFTDADFDGAEDLSTLNQISRIHRDQSKPNASSKLRSAVRRLTRRMSTAELSQHVTKAISSDQVQEQLRKAGCFDFDARAFCDQPEVGDRPISICGAHLLANDGVVRSLHDQGFIESKVKFNQAILGFFGKLDVLYKPYLSYHNHAHAVDVMSTTSWFLRSGYLAERITIADHFMALMAAALHDVGHPGRNNLFLTKTLAPLALRYNDKSILENMHVALAFETMQADEECDWLRLLQTPEHGQNLKQYVRKGLISMVLATDPSKATKELVQLKAFVKDKDDAEREGASSPPDKLKALDEQLFILGTVLHAADVSNPTKPRDIMLGWTQMILSEFWEQGDEEKSLGLPISPLCDRESGEIAVPKGQLGFIGFVIQPFYEPMTQLLSETQLFLDSLADNKAFWQEQDAKKATLEDLFGLPREGDASTSAASWRGAAAAAAAGSSPKARAEQDGPAKPDSSPKARVEQDGPAKPDSPDKARAEQDGPAEPDSPNKAQAEQDGPSP